MMIGNIWNMFLCVTNFLFIEQIFRLFIGCVIDKNENTGNELIWMLSSLVITHRELGKSLNLYRNR